MIKISSYEYFCKVDWNCDKNNFSHVFNFMLQRLMTAIGICLSIKHCDEAALMLKYLDFFFYIIT